MGLLILSDTAYRLRCQSTSSTHPGIQMARAAKNARTGRRWSAAVTKHSNALDLDHGVFTWKDPQRIARSLKRSAERSHRRKSAPYRSAMSMLTFYVNRAGAKLPAKRKRTPSN